MSHKAKRFLKKNLLITLLVLFIVNLNIIAFLFFRTDLFSSPPPPAEATASVFRSKCGTGKKSKLCYQKQFVSLAGTYDISYTADVILRLQENDSIANCHLIAHLIGQAQAKKDPQHIKNLFEQIDPTLCNAGFMHGILEEYLRLTKTKIVDKDILKKACDFTRATDPNSLNCVHALGHVIYDTTNGDLKKGVSACRQLVPGIEPKSYQCYHGLFMEHTTKQNFILHEAPQRSIAVTQKDVTELENICKSLTHYAAQGCFEELARYYLIASGNNTKKAFQMCNDITKDTGRKDCQRYLGNLAIFSSNKPYSDTIRNYCNQYVTPDDKESCYFSQIPVTLLYIKGSAPTKGSAAEMVSFCESLAPQYQRSCFLKLGSILLKLLPKEEIVKYCQSAPKEFFRECTFRKII